MNKRARENPSKVDLQVHTYYSDGNPDISLEEILELATKKFHLYGIAITDHNTIDGFREAQEKAEKYDIEIYPGVEISVKDNTEFNWFDIHVLGYLFDPDNPELNKLLEDNIKARRSRIEKMVQKIQEHGLKITMPEVEADARNREPGSSHVARVLHRNNPENIPHTEIAFDKIKRGGQFYVNEPMFAELGKVIQTIKHAGGVSILAHPEKYGEIKGIYREGELILQEGAKDIECLLKTVVRKGIDGIEVIYPYHNSFLPKIAIKTETLDLKEIRLPHGSIKGNLIDDEKRTVSLAKRLNEIYHHFARQQHLLMSGGSDYHGRDTRRKMSNGEFSVPLELVENMKKYIARRNPQLVSK